MSLYQTSAPEEMQQHLTGNHLCDVCVCVLPVLLPLTAQRELVVMGVGGVSLPVVELHPQGVVTLTGQQVECFVPQPVFSQHITETLPREHTRHNTGIIQKGS